MISKYLSATMEKAPTSPMPIRSSFDEMGCRHMSQFQMKDDEVDDLPPTFLADSTRDSLVMESSSNWSTLNSTFSLHSGEPLYRTTTSKSWGAPSVTKIEKIESSGLVS
jgi:hypothetical protein